MRGRLLSRRLARRRLFVTRRLVGRRVDVGRRIFRRGLALRRFFSRRFVFRSLSFRRFSFRRFFRASLLRRLFFDVLRRFVNRRFLNFLLLRIGGILRFVCFVVGGARRRERSLEKRHIFARLTIDVENAKTGPRVREPAAARLARRLFRSRRDIHAFAQAEGRSDETVGDADV